MNYLYAAYTYTYMRIYAWPAEILVDYFNVLVTHQLSSWGREEGGRMRSWLYRKISETIWVPLLAAKPLIRSSHLALCVCFLLFLGAFVSRDLLDSILTPIVNRVSWKTTLSLQTTPTNLNGTQNIPRKPLTFQGSTHEIPKTPPRNIEIPLNCSSPNLVSTCPVNYYPTSFHVQQNLDRPSAPRPMCPDYFRWIHEDLRPWRATGITREMVERSSSSATFRLVIVNGRAYVEKYRIAFQTRDVFTQWGILQLLRRYPGKLPDLDLMFNCFDLPVIKATDCKGPNATAPPPLFTYCSNDTHLDIPFPDWSFWGWPEVNIKPWKALLEDLKKANNRIKWMQREPYAYWKGNPLVSRRRKNLLKCNVSEKMDWNARIYAQNWTQETKQNFKQSDLASQCTHRYKIYIEGNSWSVSEKYILACDSVSLFVKPNYYDFFTRSLVPLEHYWPIRDDDKCGSIKFAVDWGNRNKQKAQEIGRKASKFIQRELSMEYVYDYMFHLLSEYAKLLKYKPTIPSRAYELCSEKMACNAQGLQKKFLMESMVKGPRDASPCTLPPPHGHRALQSFIRRNNDAVKQVVRWQMKNLQHKFT